MEGKEFLDQVVKSTDRNLWVKMINFREAQRANYLKARSEAFMQDLDVIGLGARVSSAFYALQKEDRIRVLAHADARVVVDICNRNTPSSFYRC
jgi:hypothetical protein